MSHTPPRPPRPEARSNEVTYTRSPDQEPGVSPAPVEEPIVRSAIPGVTESKMFFEVFIFNPTDEIPKAALIEVLRAARLTFSPEVFAKMSSDAQKHFLRLDRSGGVHPYRPGQPIRGA